MTSPSHAAYSTFDRIGEFTADDRGLLPISTRSNSGNWDVWRIELSSGEWTKLTDAASWEEHPRASPNGWKISFMSTRDHPVHPPTSSWMPPRSLRSRPPPTTS